MRRRKGQPLVVYSMESVRRCSYGESMPTLVHAACHAYTQSACWHTCVGRPSLCLTELQPKGSQVYHAMPGLFALLPNVVCLPRPATTRA